MVTASKLITQASAKLVVFSVFISSYSSLLPAIRGENRLLVVVVSEAVIVIAIVAFAFVAIVVSEAVVNPRSKSRR
jgi:hypothetical protein